MDDSLFDVPYALSLVPALVRGFVVTLQATALGTMLALVCGLVLALCRQQRVGFLSVAAALVVEVLRSTPLLVQLYLLFFGLPALGVSLSPLVTGVIALGLHYGAYTSEVYRAGIEAVPRAQWEAGHALRLPRTRIAWSIVLPQAIPPMLPALGNYAIAMLKDTPLLSAITVSEVVQVAQIAGSRSFRYLEGFTLVGALFLLASIVASLAVRAVEKHFVRHTH
jgi:polar amino acid transport system permease protein